MAAASCRPVWVFVLALLLGTKRNHRFCCDAFVTKVPRPSLSFPTRSPATSVNFVASPQVPKPTTAHPLPKRATAPATRLRAQPPPAGDSAFEKTVTETVDSNVSGNDEDDEDDDALQAFLSEASASGNLYFADVLLVGAGAAGVGVAHALLRGGIEPSKLLAVDGGPSVGSSFRRWHANATRFISPSWPGFPFGAQDLNAVVPDTTVGGAGGQHPTGDEYADYLERMAATSPNGTAAFPLMTDTMVTAIERILPQGCFVVRTDSSKVMIANYVVWCGGEWNSPRRLSEETFQEDAAVHYKEADIENLLQQAAVGGHDDDEENGDDDGRILLVGGGEAGADLGVALARRGARVLIVESAKGGGDDAVLDPSRNLAPVTQERLAAVEGRIEFRTGTRCTGAERCGDIVTATLEEADTGATTTISTRADVVMCTGFDSSRNPLLRGLFSFTENGNPRVTPEHDESTETRNLFLAGPMLVHKVDPCRGRDDDDDVAGDDGDDIIFCFVYKYRTRFAVVAGEIIKRHVEDQRRTYELDPDGAERGEAELEEEWDDILRRRHAMQDHYRSRGMLLTDLSCTQLACGMTANNYAPTYGYDPLTCSCEAEEADCVTC